MVDFGTLGKPDRAAMRARDAERREEFYQAQEAIRDKATKKALTITLAHEPELRTLPSGDRVVLLRGNEDGRTSPLVAVYAVPGRTSENEDRDGEFDRTLRQVGGGDRVSIAGQWSKRAWNDRAGVRQESWEFKTTAFEKGDVPLERMLENVRADRLGVPPAKEEQSLAAPRSPARDISAVAGLGAGAGR